MKKLSLVAVAVCLFVGSSFAEWGKFGVIEDGSAELCFGHYGDGYGLKVRYGLVNNLELFSTGGTVSSNYTVGVKYQVISVLGLFADVDLPTMTGGWGNHNFGVTPGINITTNFTDAFSFGSDIKLGVNMADPKAVIDFMAGIEFDYMFSDNVGMWIGVDFVYDRLTTRADGEKFDAAGAVTPGLGFFFTKDALTVGTMLSAISLNHPNKDGKESVGIEGGVEVGIKF